MGHARGLVGRHADPAAGVGVVADEPLAAPTEAAPGGKQRIAIPVSADLLRRTVGGFDVGSRMAQEANRVEMEDGRAAMRADPVDELSRRLEHTLRVGAVGRLVAQLRPRAQRQLDPALRRRDADAEAVVLAEKEQRQRQALVHGVRRAVQPRLRRRVIERRVTEAADDDGVRRPGTLDAELLRPLDRERDPDRARQVRRDRRGLRDDRELVVAEDLVPAARDRLVAGRGDAAEDVGHAVPPGLRRAREVERAGAVVEERRVGAAEREGDAGVALVPCRSDRVEAATRRLEVAGGEVALAALDLRAPDRLELGAVHVCLERPELLEQVLFEWVELSCRCQNRPSP